MFYGDRVKRGAAAVMLCVVTLWCTACSPRAAQVEPTTSTTSTPGIFASRSMALELSRRAYSNYLLLGDSVSEDGGRDVGRLRTALTPEEYAVESRSYERLLKRNLVPTGASRLTRFELQRANLSTGAVAAYVCVDVGDVRILKDSKDVTPDKRVTRSTFVASFLWVQNRLLLDKNELWSGESIC